MKIRIESTFCAHTSYKYRSEGVAVVKGRNKKSAQDSARKLPTPPSE